MGFHFIFIIVPILLMRKQSLSKVTLKWFWTLGVTKYPMIILLM